MKECLIKVGMASCGRAAGAEEIYKSAEEYIKQNNLNCRLIKTACIGMCFAEPLMELIMPNMPDITYGRITEEEVPKIIQNYLNQNPQEEKILLTKKSTSETTLQGEENEGIKKHIVLRNCGIIDPESIEDYINRQVMHCKSLKR